MRRTHVLTQATLTQLHEAKLRLPTPGCPSPDKDSRKECHNTHASTCCRVSPTIFSCSRLPALAMDQIKSLEQIQFFILSFIFHAPSHHMARVLVN